MVTVMEPDAKDRLVLQLHFLLVSQAAPVVGRLRA
jgi:hypothetical protein